jgi:hypothetical protein
MDSAEQLQPVAAPSGRAFRFMCLRCSSVLEARESQSGSPGRCPSCAALFTIPMLDPLTGLAAGGADPGQDGELPAPVHAYAAAGHNAPRIMRLEDDSLRIVCPRCEHQSPVSADNCEGCGMPFTMSGMGQTLGRAPGSMAALWMGVLAMFMGLCPLVGIIPGVIAIFLGISSFRKRGGSDAVAGIILGVLGCAISLVMLLVMS